MADDAISKRLQISRAVREISHVVNDPFLFEVKYTSTHQCSPLEAESLDGACLKRLLNDETIAKCIAKAAELQAYSPTKRAGSPITSPKRSKAIKLTTTTELVHASSIDLTKNISSDIILDGRYLAKPTGETSKDYSANYEANHEYMSSNLADLKILAIPEHYPTGPQSMSALAELYYLTQAYPLMKLLPGSHKALMSDNFELALLEGKIAVLYSRIEELKRQGRWSLRQPQRFYDPFVYKTKAFKQSFHLDNLVREGKWMSQDFRESQKLKKAVCVDLAMAVQEYWRLGKAVCIKTRPIIHLSDEEISKMNSVEVGETAACQSTAISESGNISMKLGEDIDHFCSLESLGEEEDTKNQLLADFTVNEESEPSQIECLSVSQDLGSDAIDVNLLLEPSINETSDVLLNSSSECTIPAQRKQGPFKLHVDMNALKNLDQGILKNLPTFSAFDDEDQQPRLPNPALKTPEAPLIPVSRLLYPFEDDLDWYKISLARQDDMSSLPMGPPEFQKGLFGFQSHRKFTPLKPPKPPLLKNIEYRMPTIWLPRDDKLLIHYVAEFCFNWDLISQHLLNSSISMRKYESNIERRTPWQCFERYIQLNGKFQFLDMKGVYAYSAQKWLEQAHKAQLTTKRRISPLGVGKDSIQRGHKRLRWASMFDAMRKCMKKREVGQAKASHRKSPTESSSQEQSSGVVPGGQGTATRNLTKEVASPVNPDGNPPNVGENSPVVGLSNRKRTADIVPNPAELSKLKFERDKSIQETYLNQQATRSRMVAAVTQQQRQSLTTGRGSTQATSSDSSQRNDASIGPHQRLGAGSQAHTPSAKQGGASHYGQVSHGGFPNSAGPGDLQQPVRSQQAGSAPSIPTTPNGTPYTSEQIQQLLRLQKQKRLAQLQKHNVLPQGPSNGSLPRDNISTGSPHMNQGAPDYPNTNSSSQGHSARHIPLASQDGLPRSSTLGPESNHGYPQPQNTQKARLQFAPAQVSAIINSIQTKNPNLTKEQVTKLAAQYLANIQQQQQQKVASQGPSPPKPTQEENPSLLMLWASSNLADIRADPDHSRTSLPLKKDSSQDASPVSGNKTSSGNSGSRGQDPSKERSRKQG